MNTIDLILQRLDERFNNSEDPNYLWSWDSKRGHLSLLFGVVPSCLAFGLTFERDYWPASQHACLTLSFGPWHLSLLREWSEK